MRTVRWDAEHIQRVAVADATETQLAKLAQMLKMGWQVTTLVGVRPGSSKNRIGLAAKTGAKAWLEEDGTVARCN